MPEPEIQETRQQLAGGAKLPGKKELKARSSEPDLKVLDLALERIEDSQERGPKTDPKAAVNQVPKPKKSETSDQPIKLETTNLETGVHQVLKAMAEDPEQRKLLKDMPPSKRQVLRSIIGSVIEKYQKAQLEDPTLVLEIGIAASKAGHHCLHGMCELSSRHPEVELHIALAHAKETARVAAVKEIEPICTKVNNQVQSAVIDVLSSRERALQIARKALPEAREDEISRALEELLSLLDEQKNPAGSLAFRAHLAKEVVDPSADLVAGIFGKRFEATVGEGLSVITRANDTPLAEKLIRAAKERGAQSKEQVSPEQLIEEYIEEVSKELAKDCAQAVKKEILKAGVSAVNSAVKIAFKLLMFDSKKKDTIILFGREPKAAEKVILELTETAGREAEIKEYEPAKRIEPENEAQMPRVRRIVTGTDGFTYLKEGTVDPKTGVFTLDHQELIVLSEGEEGKARWAVNF